MLLLFEVELDNSRVMHLNKPPLEALRSGLRGIPWRKNPWDVVHSLRWVLCCGVSVYVCACLYLIGGGRGGRWCLSRNVWWFFLHACDDEDTPSPQHKPLHVTSYPWHFDCLLAPSCVFVCVCVRVCGNNRDGVPPLLWVCPVIAVF